MARTRLLVHSPPWAPDAAHALLRASFGLTLAFAHGLGKVTDLAKFTAGVAARGFPLPSLLAPAAALSELVGGILLAVGLLTRPAATFVAVTMLTAAFRVHATDPFARKELALAYAAVAIAALLAGPGRFSVDARLFAKSPSS